MPTTGNQLDQEDRDSMPTQDQMPVLLTIEEAASYLRLSRAKVYSMAACGELPAVRLGRSVRVRRDRLDAWLEVQSTR
jgi:excisionase family DNA binding protein